MIVENEMQGIAESCMNFFDNHAHAAKLHMRKTEIGRNISYRRLWMDIRQIGRTSLPIPF